MAECQEEDSQKGIFLCKYLEPKNQLIEQTIQYEDIFSDNVAKQTQIVNIIDQKYQSRMKYLASTLT